MLQGAPWCFNNNAWTLSTEYLIEWGARWGPFMKSEPYRSALVVAAFSLLAVVASGPMTLPVNPVDFPGHAALNPGYAICCSCGSRLVLRLWQLMLISLTYAARLIEIAHPCPALPCPALPCPANLPLIVYSSCK